VIGGFVYLDSHGFARSHPREKRSHRCRRGRLWWKSRTLQVPFGVALSDTNAEGWTRVQLSMPDLAMYEVTVPVYP
jgi:hypothetical protein